MDKEEILAKSRKENKNVDIVEMTVINHAFKTAAVVAIVECIIISGIDDLFRGTVNSAYWTVAWSIFSTVYIYKYIYFTQQKRQPTDRLNLVYIKFF